MPLKKSIKITGQKALLIVAELALTLGLLLVTTSGKGSHLAGTEMQYTALGNGRYQIAYFIYTDATSYAPGQISPIEVRSANCGIYFNILLPIQNSTGELLYGMCPGSDPGQSFKKWKYSGTVQLPVPCTDWTLSASECCRNSGIVSIEQPDRTAMYTAVHINNMEGEFSSPSFQQSPDFYLVSGQLNHGTLHMNAAGFDSIRITRVAPEQFAGQSVTYTPGYSENSPVSLVQPMTFDANSGEYTLFPARQETGVLAFHVDGYKNGHPVASSYREHLLNAVSIGNHLPVLSGFNGSAEFTTGVCAGRTIAFELTASDADAGSDLLVEVLDSLPGAIYTSTSGNSAKTTITWTPPVVPTGTDWYTFSVRVSDHDCPINHTQVFTYRVKVSSWAINVITTPVSCIGVNNGTASVLVSGNDAPLNFNWSNSLTNTSFSNNLPFGNQTVVISEINGCSISKSIQIGGREGIAPVTTQFSNVTCQGGSDGSAGILLPDADSNYEIRWSTGEMTSVLTGITAGSRTVMVTDRQSGCAISRDLHISFNHSSPELNLGNTITACSGRSVTLDAGSGWTTSVWQDGTTGLTLNVGQSGPYSVTVTDSFGCAATESVNVQFQMCTSVNTANATETLAAMPNPAHDMLTITNQSLMEAYENWSIHDCAGRLIMQGTHELNGSEFRIDVSSFSNGMYILTASGNTASAVLRFIKS